MRLGHSKGFLNLFCFLCLSLHSFCPELFYHQGDGCAFGQKTRPGPEATVTDFRLV